MTLTGGQGITAVGTSAGGKPDRIHILENVYEQYFF